MYVLWLHVFTCYFNQFLPPYFCFNYHGTIGWSDLNIQKVPILAEDQLLPSFTLLLVFIRLCLCHSVHPFQYQFILNVTLIRITFDGIILNFPVHMHNFVFQLSTCHICLFSKIGPKILKRLRVACNLAIIGPQPVVLQYQTMYLAN